MRERESGIMMDGKQKEERKNVVGVGLGRTAVKLLNRVLLDFFHNFFFT